MATTIAHIGKEKDITALTNALYVFKEGEPAEQRRKAERALLAANPLLAEPENYIEGTLVIVPAVIGLTLADRVPRENAGINLLLDETTVRLKIAARRIDEAARIGEARRKAALALSRDTGFRKSARKALPESTALIKLTDKTLKEQEKVSDAAISDLNEAIKQALVEVERLATLVEHPPVAPPEPT
jgi:hypothetical protein